MGTEGPPPVQLRLLHGQHNIGNRCFEILFHQHSKLNREDTKRNFDAEVFLGVLLELLTGGLRIVMGTERVSSFHFYVNDNKKTIDCKMSIMLNA
jgi:hypothetical protein